MFLGNSQFLRIYQDMPWWGLLLYWGVVSWGVEDLDWLSCLLWWASSAAPTFSSGGWLHSWAPQCQVWHMMGVLGLLVLVCLLCTTMVHRQFATSFSFGSPVYCCIQCSELGYFGSIVSCQACCGWLQSSWWIIGIDMSGEQLGKYTQWHDITTCTSVDLALECCKFVWSNLSWHRDSCKGFSWLSLSECQITRLS